MYSKAKLSEKKKSFFYIAYGLLAAAIFVYFIATRQLAKDNFFAVFKEMADLLISVLGVIPLIYLGGVRLAK